MLFFGGWQLPYLDISGWTWGPLVGALTFGAKVALCCVLQVVIRWSLPRFRYDQLLGLCWKLLLPAALVNLAAGAVFQLWLSL